MDAVTKIDIMNGEINCYDENTDQRNVYPLTSDYDFFTDVFGDNQDLMTINVYNPIPRIVKFYGIHESIPASFVEINYSDMTPSEKQVWDAFVSMIKSKQ